MLEEDMIKVIQADIDGKMVVRQHKDYCGKYWFQNCELDKWDFINYYYKVLEKGETYKNWNNKTLVYGEEANLSNDSII